MNPPAFAKRRARGGQQSAITRHENGTDNLKLRSRIENGSCILFCRLRATSARSCAKVRCDAPDIFHMGSCSRKPLLNACGSTEMFITNLDPGCGYCLQYPVLPSRRK